MKTKQKLKSDAFTAIHASATALQKMGSGNVFADLGLPDADKLKIKSGLVIEFTKAMRTMGITQKAAAERMGISQPKVSAMLRGDFTNLSERKLMDCLNRLGYDIEIKVRPAAEPMGHLVLAIA
jgi:predicted XRE-type DNA-binding protein